MNAPARRGSFERDLVFHITVSDCRFAAVEARDYVVLDGMLKTWRENNAELGLSGALLLCDGSFVHLIEGPKNKIRKLLARVVADPLHSNVRTLREESSLDRRFPASPLAYVGPSRWVQRALSNHALGAMGSETPEEADFLIDLILSFVGE